MNVYVLLQQADYEGASCHGVYSTPELARAAAERFGKCTYKWSGDGTTTLNTRGWCWEVETWQIDGEQQS